MFDPPNDEQQKNVLGGPIALCSGEPLTGYYRTGCCHTSREDRGMHTVCVELTDAFLSYSRSVGNDLSTPRPEFNFPGLKPGQRWCLCAPRYKQALEAGVAPKVFLASTHEATLKVIDLDTLIANALDAH